MRMVLAGCCLLTLSSVARAEPVQLFLHIPAHDERTFDVAARLGLALMQQGYEVVDVRPVPIQMSRTTIRFFRPELRGEAERLKGELEQMLHENRIEDGTVRIQDFTHFRPLPRPGSLELWFRPE